MFQGTIKEKEDILEQSITINTYHSHLNTLRDNCKTESITPYNKVHVPMQQGHVTYSQEQSKEGSKDHRIRSPTHWRAIKEETIVYRFSAIPFNDYLISCHTF